MLTIGRVAAELGLHRDTVRRYEQQGRFPASRRSPMNGYRIWTEADLQEMRSRLLGRQDEVREEVAS